MSIYTHINKNKNSRQQFSTTRKIQPLHISYLDFNKNYVRRTIAEFLLEYRSTNQVIRTFQLHPNMKHQMNFENPKEVSQIYVLKKLDYITDKDRWKNRHIQLTKLLKNFIKWKRDLSDEDHVWTFHWVLKRAATFFNISLKPSTSRNLVTWMFSGQ